MAITSSAMVSEDSRVFDWRLAQLLKMLYPVAVAEMIAADSQVCLHELEALIAQGCRRDLARRILQGL